jgi:hypothetical protein
MHSLTVFFISILKAIRVRDLCKNRGKPYTPYIPPLWRPAPGKQSAKVFDYIDQEVGVLMYAAKQRQKMFTA